MELTNYQTIKASFKEGLAHIELNRSEKGNSYNKLMLSELIHLLTQLHTSSDLKVIIFTGSGKNFCTGADLKWMSDSCFLSEQDNMEDFSLIPKMYNLLLNSPALIISSVQGKVLGGGIGLVATSDYVLASDKAEFSLKEINWGLIPGVITPMICGKIGVSKFVELSLTAKTILANDAYSIGLVHSLSSDLKKDTQDFLDNISKKSLKTIRLFKASLRLNSQISEDHLNELAKYSAELRKEQDFNTKYNSQKK